EMPAPLPGGVSPLRASSDRRELYAAWQRRRRVASIDRCQPFYPASADPAVIYSNRYELTLLADRCCTVVDIRSSLRPANDTGRRAGRGTYHDRRSRHRRLRPATPGAAPPNAPDPKRWNRYTPPDHPP